MPDVLKPCRTCGQPVSPLAKTCPKCGAPDPLIPVAITAVTNIGCLLTMLVTVPILALVAFGICAKS